MSRSKSTKSDTKMDISDSESKKQGTKRKEVPEENAIRSQSSLGIAGAARASMLIAGQAKSLIDQFDAIGQDNEEVERTSKRAKTKGSKKEEKKEEQEEEEEELVDGGTRSPKYDPYVPSVPGEEEVDYRPISPPPAPALRPTSPSHNSDESEECSCSSCVWPFDHARVRAVAEKLKVAEWECLCKNEESKVPCPMHEEAICWECGAREPDDHDELSLCRLHQARKDGHLKDVHVPDLDEFVAEGIIPKPLWMKKEEEERNKRWAETKKRMEAKKKERRAAKLALF